MFSRKYYTKQRNSTNLLIDRQYGNIDSLVCQELQTSDQYIDRLELECILEGHNGCVNCLEWSEDGRILASGSDDLCVFLWDVFRKKKLMSFRTPHIGNMFSVKFLPKSQGNLIASCAADKCVYVFDLNRNKEPIWSCQCHWARVKRLATAPDCPFQFWSASEDGSILQFDIREPHHCNSGDKILLLNLLRMVNLKAEAKCIAVNPRRPELLAIGANDGYARMYDRRLLKVDSWNADSRRINDGYNRMYGNANDFPSNAVPPRSVILDASFTGLPKNAVTYFCPGQYYNTNPMLVSRDTKAITYLTFNSDGNELLVNMGAEHVYLYDINECNEPHFLNLPQFEGNNAMDVECGTATGATKVTSSISGNSLKRKLPEHVEILKKMGNDFLENEKYLRAIDMYTEAIILAPDCPILYLNRATALMRRRFFGDVYAALRDCHTALKLDPGYIKAHFRLARALLDLGRTNDSEECLNELIRRFPTYETNHGVMMLKKDITERKKSDNTSINIENNNNGINNGNSAGNDSSNMDDDENDTQQNHFQYLDILRCEWSYRLNSKDYKQRFIGHRNCTTDIKEANFFGKCVVAGSDDGNFFIWDRNTCKIKSIYKADMAIVNCVQPHPNICLLATSGIDHEIKIWSPLANVCDEKSNRVQYIDGIVDSNQHKMGNNDLFELNPPRTFCRSS